MQQARRDGVWSSGITIIEPLRHSTQCATLILLYIRNTLLIHSYTIPIYNVELWQIRPISRPSPLCIARSCRLNHRNQHTVGPLHFASRCSKAWLVGLSLSRPFDIHFALLVCFVFFYSRLLYILTRGETCRIKRAEDSTLNRWLLLEMPLSFFWGYCAWEFLRESTMRFSFCPCV